MQPWVAITDGLIPVGFPVLLSVSLCCIDLLVILAMPVTVRRSEFRRSAAHVATFLEHTNMPVSGVVRHASPYDRKPSDRRLSNLEVNSRGLVPSI
jgi:hypothetical protein